MEAIATLANDDPYLRLPFKERLHARRERRERIAAKAVPDRPMVLRALSIVETPAPVIVPKDTPEACTARQLKTWFSVEKDLGPVETVRPTIEQIQRVICRHYDVRRNDLIGERRFGPIIRPRHIAIYLAKTLTLRSLPEVGRRFGGRDHTSILSAVRKIERLVAIDPDLNAEVEELKIKIAGAPA